MFEFYDNDDDECFESHHPSDDGNPHNYYFDVREDSSMVEGGLSVIVTVADYFDEEGCCSDWHLGWAHPELDQVCEGIYEVLDPDLTVKDVENMFLAHGFRKSKEFTEFLNDVDH
jgi:hypothetical protein